MKVICLILLLTGLPGAAMAGAPIQLKAAFHVHTGFSTGALSLEELIKEARREGIGVLILTDNFLLRFEYGLFPLRGVLKKVAEKPSAGGMGLGRYLGAIEEAQRRFPDVILIPGVEVVPYYYWTGSLVSGDLTLWNSQKNLLVIGLSGPEAYARIPAIGNGRALRMGWTGRFTLGLAALALGGGALLMGTRREQRLRLTHFSVKVQKRHRLLGSLVLGVGVLLLLEGFTSSELNPYQGDLGVGPYQRVIDYAEASGGQVVWSFPEARDFGRHDLGRVGKVTVRTDPYPDALLQTKGYTGFGAVYPDTVTFTEPGRQWDQLLLEYTQGRRARPAWGIGEVGYHGSPKPLSEALTIFLVSERSRPAILTALKEGRLYAVSPLRDYHLLLENFSLSQEGRREWTPMGGELEVDGRAPLLISLRVSASNGSEVPFTLRLIRSGRVLDVLAGRTPFEKMLRLPPPEETNREFFRLEITTPHRLLSNPIFVRRG